jgi:RNA:NAD 2'-phosphotransferase (TPT1/KptA family)
MKDLQSDRSEWAAITEHDFAHMIDTSTKRRFKLCGGKVRALHGHSVAGKPRNLNVYSRTPRLLVGNDGGFREVPASRKGVQYLIELPPRETALLIRERIK